MFKYYNPLLSKNGDVLPGRYVRLFTAGGAEVDLFADASGTPISTESGVANAAVSDTLGMVRFYVANGTYDIRLYDEGDNFVSAEVGVPMLDAGGVYDDLASTDAEKGAALVKFSSGDTVEDLASDAAGKGASLVKMESGETAEVAILARPTTAALASSTGADMLGSQLDAVGAVPRTQRDINSDFLHAKSFGVKANDGVTDETAEFKNAIAAAILLKKPLHFDGDVVVSDSLLTGALINTLKIFGSGESSARIINKCIGKTCLNIGNSYYVELRDFSIVGNGLTGVAGNGHAISMADPEPNVGTFLPGFTTIERLNITGHRGHDVNWLGAAMTDRACGIYMGGALSADIRHCYLGNNQYGIYANNCYQPTFDINNFEGNHLAGMVAELCENLRLIDPDFVGANDGDSGGTIHVGSAGAGSGGYNVRAGAVVDFYSQGSVYRGGKYKNHKYAALSLFAPDQPLVSSAWLRQDAEEGTCGIYAAFGASIEAVKFAFSGAAATANRFGIIHALQQGYQNFGSIRDCKWTFGGNGKFGHCIFIDGAAASYMSGVIAGNRAGDATPIPAPSTLDAFVRIKGAVRNIIVRDNHITAAKNMTVAACYKFDETTNFADQGLTFDANSAWDAFGDGTIIAVKVGVPPITGLQASGKFEAVAYQVADQQVIGPRQPSIADAAGGDEVAKINAILAALRTHGMIAT